MGVSRGPVREALSQLEREGLVIRQRNRSAWVARLSRKDLDEIYSLRNALECLAVTYACRNITASDLDAMQAVVNTMASCVERGTTEQEAAELDLRFHDILYQASHHERLIALWSNLRSQFYLLLLNRNVANPDFAEKMSGGHQEILDAIRDRDVKRALSTIETHVRFAYETVLASQRSAPLTP
jgi:DNA-binding GntR family transcriptional regulator